jgi:tetratricopeptide (TPR) repeat protein
MKSVSRSTLPPATFRMPWRSTTGAPGLTKAKASSIALLPTTATRSGSRRNGTTAVTSDYKEPAVKTYLARAVLYGRMGQYDRAIEDDNEIIKLEPDNTSTVAALNQRCAGYFFKNDLDRAIADFDAALRVVPSFADALYGRGLAKQKKGDAAGGNADIAAAKESSADVVQRAASRGMPPK